MDYVVVFFVFKQKTAYEMRISNWSSDVCSSDLDNAAEEVREVVQQVRPSLLQFHGDEDDAFCRGFGVPYVKAIGMGNALVGDAVALQVRYPGAAAFLFEDRKSTRLNSSH